jgi:hypothetical protein
MAIEDAEKKLRKIADQRAKQGPRVASSTLEELMGLKEESLVLTMRAQEADATFRRRVAEVCRDLKAPIDQSIICLGCGLIRSIQEERCPACVG